MFFYNNIAKLITILAQTSYIIRSLDSKVVLNELMHCNVRILLSYSFLLKLVGNNCNVLYLNFRKIVSINYFKILTVALQLFID